MGVGSLLGQWLFLEEGIVYTKAIRQEEVYSNNWKEEADVADIEEIEGWVALGMIDEIDRHYNIPDFGIRIQNLGYYLNTNGRH